MNTNSDTVTTNGRLEIKMINQGSYGCIFKPGIKCDYTSKDSKDTISKIQKMNPQLENEIHIGKKISNIANYQWYFAPIIENCEIDIHKIPKAETDKCNVIKNEETASLYNKKPAFVSNKIRYLGNMTLDTHLFKISYNIKNLNKSLIYTTKHLLTSIEKLNEVNKIVHFDITNNNLMYDEKLGLPIIIDFGLSFETTQLLLKPLNTIFYTTEIYPYWCVEIYFISVIIHTKSLKDDPKNKENIVSESEINEIINTFFEKNILFKIDNLKLEVKSLKDNYIHYFNKFKNILWKTCLDELLFDDINHLKEYSVWDVYSLAVTYLFIIEKHNFTKYNSDPTLYKIINFYKEIITENIYERKSATIIKKRFITLLNNSEL